MPSDTLSVMDMPVWLSNYLKTIEKPKVPTQDKLKTIKDNALTAKIQDVEQHNLKGYANAKKRIPEKLDIEDVAAICLHLFTFRYILMSQQSDDGLLGLYVPDSNDIWQKSTARMSQPQGIYTTNQKLYRYIITRFGVVKQKDIDEVIHLITIYAPEVEVTTDTHLFPVNNGIYNQQTKELQPYTPDYVYTTKISVDYNPHAQNPVIMNPDNTTWDVESWLTSLSASPEVNDLLWQVIAASLQPNRGMNKSIWFYSESGNNGKGTVGQLIKNMLGKGNYASLPVEAFNHEFKKKDLLKAVANIADENDVDSYIDSVKDYKASVTGDDIIINQKHKDPVTIQFKGLNIQMMNGLPKTKDKTGSFYRRLIIVPFIKSFTNNGERSYIKTDYINRTDVLEYALAKALSLEFEEFIIPPESQYLLEQYKEKNNPVLDFWNEMNEQFVWQLIPRQFLYDLFQKWFERSNPSGKIIGQRTFFDNLSPIIDSHPDWSNHLGSQSTNIRTGTLMDDDEPLITEYGLDKPYKNGAPSPWSNATYAGTNPKQKRHFVRKTKYRGILRN